MLAIRSLLLFLSVNFITQALAEPKVKIKGGFDFQSGYIKNNRTYPKYIASSRQKFHAFNSSAHFNLELEDEFKDIVEYGGKISLETAAKNDRKVASFIYLLTDYGKLELGTDKSANTKMKISGYTGAAGTAGGWEAWAALPSNRDKAYFIPNFGNFLDAKTRESGQVEYSRKISYFSPLLAGFQFGFSYIPDSTSVGYLPHKKEVTHQIAKPYKYNIAIRDGLAYGVNYLYSFANSENNIKLSIVGESGKVKPLIKNPPYYKFSNLNAFTFGTEINYDDYLLAASYSNYNKSLMCKELDRLSRKAYIYGATLGYKFDKLTPTVSFLSSFYKKNILNGLTLACNYKLAEGILPYSELTLYSTKEKYINKNSKLKITKTNGIIFLMGVKLVL